MARLMMPENGAMPAMSYYSPYVQAPYYVIPQTAQSIPYYSHGSPQYVYGPAEYGQSKLVPPLSHQYPVDSTNKDLHEAMKPIPQGFVAPNARHPMYVHPGGMMVGQPVHYPVYGDASRAHLHQVPGGAHYVNSFPVAAPGTETPPAGQPGMRWKLVPVTDQEDATPIVSPKASRAPVMLLKSPEENPEPGSEGENAVSDPRKNFLSLLFPKPGDKQQTKDVEAPEVGVDTPKTVKIIPVTDAPKDDVKRAMDQAPREEKKAAAVEAERTLKECGKKQPNKSSAPTLKPIRLVPSLEFVKKKPTAVTSKGTQTKSDSHQTSEEAASKLVEKGAREKSVVGSSDAKSHTVQRGDEPSAKRRLVADPETAARLIQSVFRGYLVRRCQPLKHLRDIARVMKEYRALAADKNALLERCKDPAEWTKASEAIMSLLLQLDVIQGVDPVVRDIRKYTSKEVLKLQSEVDAVKAQPEERVDDLLLKLLEKLPSSGQRADTDLVSEVVKRLSLLREHERNKVTDTTSQGESTVPEMAGANSRTGMADDAAVDTNLPVSSPTEFELQKLAETVAADFVDVVLAHSEDTVGSVQSMAGQGILDSHDTALLEVCEDVDVQTAMSEKAAKERNVESGMEGTGRVAPTESAGSGETQAEEFNTVDGGDKERTSDIVANKEVPLADKDAATGSDSVKADGDAAIGSDSVKVMSDEEKVSNIDLVADSKDDRVPAVSMAPESATDADSVTQSLADEEKVPNIDAIADLKVDPASTEFSREGCTSKESVLEPEAATDAGSRIEPLAGEEKVPHLGLKDDPLSTEAGFDSPEQATTPVSNENGDAIEVINVDSPPAGVSPSYSTRGLWNGLDSSCLDVRSSPLQPLAPDSEEVSRESSHPGIDQQCNISSNPSHPDVVERISMKVQIPDKSFSSQEGSIAGDSPTSVLDAAISMAPVEEPISEDIAQDHRPMNEGEALQCAISDLESLNNEGEFLLNEESLQLQSAISDLHSLNNSGQGFLNNLSPIAVPAKVYLPKPPSLSPEALDLLEHGVEISERLCPSSTSSPSSETTLMRHLVEENAVLKELVKDVLKWSQWQSSATLSLHKMMEKLALEVLETKATAKKAAKCKHGKDKRAHGKKKSFCKL